MKAVSSLPPVASVFSRAMQRMFLRTFEQGIHKGTLTLTTPDGAVHRCRGDLPGPQASWQIHSWQVVALLASRGDIGLGEAYAAGLWDTDDLEALFCLFIENLDSLERYADGSVLSRLWFRLLNHGLRRNSLAGSSRNIRAHYDVGNQFYRLWLDESMTYSSALYANPAMPLEQAQHAKYGRILERLQGSGRLLEIGCGWGGFAEAAAGEGRHVTGLTISPSQQAYATERLGHKADIRLQDYRHSSGVFDAVVSIEMFEAVGTRYWKEYFSTLKARLAHEGKAVVQTITIRDELFDAYRKRSDYIRHYVFPGGMLPSVAAFREAAGRAGLQCREVFAFGQDYARTLREWLQRFDARQAEIRALGYGDAFIRSWRLYMAMCAASFACARTDVVQVELAHA
jgi:cyclopropane-fatty-acyl-phospholipid synthase